MSDSAPTHGVVVLAAGASRRLGRAKQLLVHRGETLVRYTARLALGTNPVFTVIVLGAEADTIFGSVADLPVRRVDCADWTAGLGASLRAGLAALPDDVGGALIVLCDQPALDAAHLEALCAAWREDPRRAVASAYAGRLGVPALLPRAWFADLSAATGDRGARDLLASRADSVRAIANEALARDIDYPHDLTGLEP